MYVWEFCTDLLVFLSGIPLWGGGGSSYVFTSLLIVSLSVTVPHRVEVLGYWCYKVGK